jgi:hypothetical protein
MGIFSRTPSNVTRIAAPHGAAHRATTTLMEQRGWKQVEPGVFAGPYATRHGTWDGEIERAADTLRVFIYDPPARMRRHPKWPCFHSADGGWYRIHLHTNPVDGDPNAVVRYVEQLITESYHY